MDVTIITANQKWVWFIIQGAGTTLANALLPLFFATIFGTILAIVQINNRKGVFYYLTRCYLSIIRGTPLILQLSICYYLVPNLINFDISSFNACLIALSLNSAAYMSEVIRSGIQSVDRGQFEAAKSLGVPYYQMMIDIILPQALNNVLPALINEAINLIKETAIIGIIGEMDIMRRAQIIAAEQYNYFGPLLVAGGTYYILVLILTLASTKLEYKLKHRYSK